MNKFFLHLIFPLVLVLNRVTAGVGFKDADDYQKNSDLQYKWAIESLEVFPFEINDKILDLGCGTGSITAKIAAHVPGGIVIGLDISPAMIKYAREHHAASNLIYMEGDARKLPFVEQLDKAVALLSLHWVLEQELALDCLYQALKPHGMALITLVGRKADNLGPVVDKLIKKDFWGPYFPELKRQNHYYTAAEYGPLLEQAGFRIEKMSQDVTYTPFKDRGSLEGFFRPLCHFLDRLPADLQQQFVEELVDIVLESNQILSDGSILLHDFKIEAIVSKP